MIPRTRSHYQTGTIVRNARSKGPDVWVFRYRDYSQGQPLNRKRIVGDVEQYPTWSDAKAAVDSLRIEVNARQDDKRSLTVEGAWQHFQENELHDPDVNRSPTTIQVILITSRRKSCPGGARNGWRTSRPSSSRNGSGLCNWRQRARRR